MPILLYGLECFFLPKSDVQSLDFVVTRFYRAMHFSAFARSWDRMSSVCLSVRLSVCNVGDL